MPTHLSKVTPPAGTELMVGITKDGNFGGNGMGTQFYFKDNVKEIRNLEFKPFRKIGDKE